jgi:hypothetical protein
MIEEKLLSLYENFLERLFYADDRVAVLKSDHSMALQLKTDLSLGPNISEEEMASHIHEINQKPGYNPFQMLIRCVYDLTFVPPPYYPCMHQETEDVERVITLDEFM